MAIFPPLAQAPGLLCRGFQSSVAGPLGRASVGLITPKPGSSPLLSVTEGELSPMVVLAGRPNYLFTYFTPVSWERLKGCRQLPKEHGVWV